MSFDISQVKARILTQLEPALRHLFPNGTIHGREFCVGSLAGEAGESLKVHLNGDRAGVFKDFATGEAGDILTLWAMVRGLPFKEAFPEMANWAGFTNIARPRVTKPRPNPPDQSAVGSMRGTPVYEYLRERSISEESMRKYRIRTHQRKSEWNTNFWCEQYWDTQGHFVMLKSTGIKLDGRGKKDIWTTTPYYTLWGWWLVPDDCREIIACEGGIDAMSLDQIGFGMPCLSLPAGSSNLEWIENDWPRLQLLERIWICTDMDEPGEACAKAIARRLGPSRCWRLPVPSPFKDANQALLQGEPEALEPQAWVDAAFQYSPEALQPATAYRQEAFRSLRLRKKASQENNFIWPSVPFEYRNGELTIISGTPSGGKSAFLYQTHLHEMRVGEKTFIASWEIAPGEMLSEIAIMLSGRMPSDPQFDDAMDWVDGKLWFYLPPEDGKFPDLLADMEYAVLRYGCSRLVLDSLFFLVGKEDYEGQDGIVRKLKAFAKNHNVHVALVAHSIVKKGGAIVPGMAEVEGSGGLVKPIDNGITLHRNFGKEEAIEKAEESNDANKLETAQQLHDGLLYIWKQRLTGKLRRQKLWFDEHSKSFRLNRDQEIVAPLSLPTPEQQEKFF